jgi:NADH dehydrogenase
MATDGRHRVVIIGGGFGGLHAARSLKKAPVQVTLLDRRNFHLFQPLLYQVATGGLSPANIAAPLRGILSRQKNAQVLLAEAVGFDAAGRRVLLRDGVLPYDSLIVAAGSTHSYFGRQEWEPLAPGLKTIEDATAIRSRILMAFERAERETDPVLRREWMTFVIVGAGPTGVELAGTLAEIARYTLKHDFRTIDPEDATILLVDAADRVLTAYPAELSARARRDLERRNIVVRTNALVAGVAADHVVFKQGERTEVVRCRTVLWAAGVQASPLAAVLAEATGAERDRAGRLLVLPDLTLPGHPEVFAIGDMVNYPHLGGKPLPGLAPVAIQQGQYAARVIASRLTGRSLPPFRYKDFGSMATIGRGSAVAQYRRWKFTGFFAWLMWLFVHLMKIVQYRNRLLVLIQWGWNYLTFDRAARLITGEMDPFQPAPGLEHAAQEEPAPASVGENPRA